MRGSTSCSPQTYNRKTTNLDKNQIIQNMDSITLELYRHRFAGIAEEMGEALKRTGFSPNIKERLDFSCAIFDAQGELVAQAAHIPVHLGAMSASVSAARGAVAVWREGDVVILNDPFAGGTHLPDITVVAPVFYGGDNRIFSSPTARTTPISAA